MFLFPFFNWTIMAIRTFQRAMHRSNILSLIRVRGMVSRSDLAQETGLSKASVTGLTADMIEEGLIEEKQTGESEGGRRPILLAIRPDGVHVIGVNMAIDQIRVVIINFQAEIKASRKVILETRVYEPSEIVEIIAGVIQELMWEANFSKSQIAGVGVGIPGPVDSVHGIIRFLPNYGWTEVAFRDMLAERINHPVYIDNGANNLAIAEHWFGDAVGVDNFLVITLENGVGSGLVLNSQLVRGHMGIAGEFGHLCADPEGPLCRCGRKGCIEALAGNNAIIREAGKLIDKGMWSSKETTLQNLVFQDVLEELEKGNRELEKIYEQAGRSLGMGIYNMMILLNPELVIVTGIGVRAGDVLLEPMFNEIQRLREGKFANSRTEIQVQRLTNGDWARESGTLVLREIYKFPAFS